MTATLFQERFTVVAASQGVSAKDCTAFTEYAVGNELKFEQLQPYLTDRQTFRPPSVRTREQEFLRHGLDPKSVQRGLDQLNKGEFRSLDDILKEVE